MNDDRAGWGGASGPKLWLRCSDACECGEREGGGEHGHRQFNLVCKRKHMGMDFNLEYSEETRVWVLKLGGHYCA